MNVEMINNHKTNMTSDIDKTTYGNLSSHDSRMKTEKLGYSLDITGKVTENAAYGKEDLKSVEEMMQTVGMQDVTVQRNYMAVMSNSMSDEDFGEMMEEGANPLNCDLSESVTNLDRIKIKMAESGQIIVGFNDDITDDELQKALGSNSAAGSLIKKALNDADLPDSRENIDRVKEMFSVSGNITTLNDQTLTYMINENLEPTVENLYKAEYSASKISGVNQGVRYGGVATYAVGNLNDDNWNSIKDRALDIVRQSDIADENEGLVDAKWLVAHDIPLTADTLNRLENLKSVILPAQPTDLLKAAMVAVEEGKSPMEANLLETDSLYSKAVSIRDEFINMSDGGDVTRRRQLEEVRLHMSCEANLVLLKKGISIDTKDLNKLVDDLKEAEREFYRPILTPDAPKTDIGRKSDDGNSFDRSTDRVLSDDELDARIDLFKETRRVVESIPKAPVRVIADTADSSDFNLGRIEHTGEALKAAYEKAGEKYETFMTAPRADMGDSIRKAFRNVDEILEDLDFELNDTNRKAIRTLGYAGMMINKESVEKIRQATMSVERVISMMTPAKTLSMIREGHNPLSENIFELEENLSKENIEESTEKYSKFLWKLERNGDITPDEKDAYIGMFRLFDKIEKMDGKVIGNVLSNGEELTMENMLKAVRSNKHRNMDVTVDDDFGMLEELVTKGDSISDQIEKGFMQILYEKPQKDYVEEKLRNIRAAAKNPEEAEEILSSLEQPVTIENIVAAGSLSSGMGKAFKRMFGNDSSSDEDKLDKKDADELTDDFTDRESAENAYERFMLKAQKIAKERILDSKSYEDVQNFAMHYKQIGFASTLSKGQSYEVPIYTSEGWTSVHVSFKTSEKGGPGVSVSFESEEYGKVKGNFTIKPDGVEGILASDSRDGIDGLKARDEVIRNEFGKSGLNTANLSFVFARGSIEDKYFDDSQSEKVTNEKLYKVAKSFIKAMTYTK